MTKSEEIALLKQFKGSNGYFNEYFKDEDIDQMCDNIKNDHPVEFCTAFNSKAEEVTKVLKSTQEKFAETMNEMFEGLVVAACYEDALDGHLYEFVKGKIGQDMLIKYKHKNGYELSEEEIEYLVNKL